MTCNEIVPQHTPSVIQNNTVAQAAHLMDSSNRDFLAVCGFSAAPIGVITARDIVLRVLARQRAPALTRVDEVMTAPPLFVFSDAPVELACQIMGEEGVTRLLVLDDAGHLEGVLSLADILLNASEETVLVTARHVLVKSTLGWHSRRRIARPHPALLPRPAFLSDATDPAWLDVQAQSPPNSARSEAEVVLRGGTNPFKEFP
jgi:CBS domain-containing protein